MRFTIPCNIQKSESGEGEMRIRGYASTPDIDSDQEQILQEGLDIDRFVNHGFFNFDHDNSIIVGYPDKEKTKITSQGLYVEGTILDTEIGKSLWETAVALQKAKADRQLGMSIEGEVLERGPNNSIRRARVTNVAITAKPVNPNCTWEAIAKSLTTEESGPLILESLDSETKNNLYTFIEEVKEENPKAIENIIYLQNILNQTKEVKGIQTYLMLFKGLYGQELEEESTRIFKEMKEAQ